MAIADDETATRAPPAPTRDRAFLVILALICAAAFSVRALNAFAWLDYRIGGDALYFHGQANALAEGFGFVDGFAWLRSGATEPSALHPPAYPALLSLVSFAGATSETAHRIASCLIGTGTVAVLGLLGRRIGGRGLGLTTAVIAAIAPALWIADSQLLSEGLYGLGIALALLAAYHYPARPTTISAVMLAGAVSLAALTRGEALLLFPLLVLPLVVLHGRARRSDLAPQLAVVMLCGVLFVGPWVLYNTMRFDHRVTYSHNSGGALMLTNCDATYGGELLGYWSATCLRPGVVSSDEATEDAAARRVGLGYVRDHAGRVPVVTLARVGRLLEVYRVSQDVSLAADFEGRGRAQARLQLWAYYLFIVLSIPGAIVLRRQGVPLWPLVAMIVLTILTAALIYGNVRFRVPLEIVLIVTAASVVTTIVRRLRRFGPTNASHPRSRLVGVGRQDLGNAPGVVQLGLGDPE